MKNNEKYRIKVNRIPSENEKYLYNKHSKNESSNLNKIPQNISNLYKRKYNHEIITNEYHQSPNDINTNINIKINPSENSNVNNSRINRIINRNCPNNISFNKYFDKNPIEYPLKNEDNESSNNYSNIERSFNKEKFIRNADNISSKLNSLENNSIICSPFSNAYSTNSRDKEYKKRFINNYTKDIRCNNSNNNYKFQSPIEYVKNKNIQSYTDNNNKENENFIYSNYGKYKLKSKKNKSQDEIVPPTTLRNRKKENPPNIINNYYKNRNISTSPSNRESLRTKKMKEMNEIVFSSGNKLKDIFRNRFDKNYNNLITNDNYYNKDNRIESLNIKLEYYRIKLFKEFYKHFYIFYISYMRKIFYLFLENLIDYRKYKTKNYIYNRKNYFRNNNTNENNSQKKKNILIIRDKHGEDLIEVFKNSTMNDYYKLYNQFQKNRNIDPDLKKMVNYSLNKENYNLKSNIYINTQPTPLNNNKYHINSAPRINKYLNNLYNYSIKRNSQNKNIINSNSKSPSFRIGNRTILNNDISFGLEGNEKEKELFRDTKELNKKFEQIQRRKKKSERKNRDLSLDQSKDISIDKSINKSADINRIKDSEEYYEFSELRKYVQALKNHNNLKKNILNIGRNDKYINQINSIENDNNNNVVKSNINNKDDRNNNFNFAFSKTFYNNKKDILNKNENKNIKIGDNIKLKKERRTDMARKNIQNLKIKNANTLDKNNNFLMKDKKYNSNYEKNYIEDNNKVKVNINKKIILNNKENNIKKNEIIINNNNKINAKNNFHNNYNILSLSNSKLTNSPNKNYNIYYSTKNNKINNNTKFYSNLIKDISTKDKRININIYYYNYSKKNNQTKLRYDFLEKENKYSICILGSNNIIKNNITKLKNKLAAIKEEEISNQNSKIYDESGTFDNINLYENKKNKIIYHQNELLYSKFAKIINHIIKQYFMNRIKAINNKINKNIYYKKKENIINEKNLNNKIYSKKNRFKKNIEIGEGIFNRINLKTKGKRYNFRNKAYQKYEDIIIFFRMRLIKYFLNFNK